MREALREVSEESTGCRRYLLRIQPCVVGEPDELIHQADGTLDQAAASEGFREPERTREERALGPVEPVVTGVAAHERAVPELAAHRFDRPSPSVCRRVAVAAEKAEQQACVELGGAGVAYVASLLLREAAGLHEVADRLRLPTPASDAAGRDQATFGQIARAVERDPAHHLRMGEVLRLAPHLPDPGVGLPPDQADEIRYLGQTSSDVSLDLVPGDCVHPRGLKQLAIGIQLELRCGGVADSHRA